MDDNLQHSVPAGWWRSERGFLSVEGATLTAWYFARLEDIYLGDVGRLPLQAEVADLLEFASAGMIRGDVGDVAAEFCTALGAPNSPTARIVGSQSPAARARDGWHPNTDPCTGQLLKRREGETPKHGEEK